VAKQVHIFGHATLEFDLIIMGAEASTVLFLGWNVLI
jgi:hypothetical protein